MSDPFFASASKKRKRDPKTDTRSHSRNGKSRVMDQHKNKAPAVSRRQDEDDDEITDSSGSESGDVDLNSETEFEADSASSEEEDLNESAADKRRRLAKQYLENLQNEAGEYDFDAKDIDEDIIASRLKTDVAEEKGYVYRFIGEHMLFESAPQITRVQNIGLNGLSVRYPNAYTVSKDMELTKWDISGFQKKPRKVKYTKGGARFAEVSKEHSENGHCDEIFSVAASPDGKYVATGGKDRRIIIWSTESLAPLRALVTNVKRGEVMGLAFRRNTDQLYAACSDLKIRTYSVGQMAQLETLYGHQDCVIDIAALGQERCVTVGSRDKTAMLWKIADETRLTFRGGDSLEKVQNDFRRRKLAFDESKFFAEGSIDCVSMIDDSHFVTGSDNGNIALWSTGKKKPIWIERQAHGLEPTLPASRASGEADVEASELQVPKSQPYWITAIHAIPFSDVFFTGSWNGTIKVWKLSEDLRGFALLAELNNARGVVTSIDVAEAKKLEQGRLKLIATLSKEHKLGRWIRKGEGFRNALYSVVIDVQVAKR